MNLRFRLVLSSGFLPVTALCPGFWIILSRAADLQQDPDFHMLQICSITNKKNKEIRDGPSSRPHFGRRSSPCSFSATAPITRSGKACNALSLGFTHRRGGRSKYIQCYSCPGFAAGCIWSCGSPVGRWVAVVGVGVGVGLAMRHGASWMQSWALWCLLSFLASIPGCLEEGFRSTNWRSWLNPDPGVVGWCGGCD